MNPVFGGGLSTHKTPAKHGSPAHPSSFTHGLLGSLESARTYPLGHAPQTTAPFSYAHVVCASHPPLLVKHGFATHVSPSPTWPAGHRPHVRPRLGGFESSQCTPAAHGKSAHAS